MAVERGVSVNLSCALTLGTQLARVEYVVQAGSWLTLDEIAAHTRTEFDVIDSPAAVSARLRQLRAAGWTVERRGRNGSRRFIEYRAIAPVPAGTQAQLF